MRPTRFRLLFSAAVLGALPSYAAITAQISPSVSSPQPVGTPVEWTVTASDTLSGSLDYQFSVASLPNAYQVVQDFSPVTTITWAPSIVEGGYSVQVAVRNKSAGELTSVQSPFTITSRITGSSPVISSTAHPLVALYSAPSCPLGSVMYVIFGLGSFANRTNTLACTGTTSMNFYVAGMAPSTTYGLRHIIQTGSQRSSSATLHFTTGAIPSSLLFPKASVKQSPDSQTDTAQSLVVVDHMGPNGAASSKGAYMPTAYALNGTVLWYYPGRSPAAQNGAYYSRPVDGGTFMVHANDPNSAWVTNQIWREVDLAGNTIRQTNVTRVNEQINAAGYLGCTSFSHDAIRLPNGHTLIICTQEQIFPPGTQGATGPVDIAGDGIVDLDPNLQLSWYWSAYDHLDINRAAILGETIQDGSGFVPLVLASVANDWLHSNSLNYIPSSGDLLISLRHQDWVARISYKDGAGDGSIVWELGPQGSFSINSADPYPWFTHQHDAEYELGGTQVLSLFDNGNTRAAQNPGVTENSRGYALNIDETNMATTPVLLADLGGYSNGGGSAQRLDNGNYHFDASVLGPAISHYAQHIEVVPIAGSTGGAINYVLQCHSPDYRSYRMASLYRLN